VRRGLYMAALTAARRNHILAPFTNACARLANHPKSLSPPSCENYSSHSTVLSLQRPLEINTVTPFEKLTSA
jgi:hypothetical protein